MDWNAPVASLPSIGPYFVKKLKSIGINTVQDLVFHFPHRYENFSLTTNISAAQSGETVTIRGQILEIKNVFTRFGKKLQKATVSDGDGQIEVTWFNQIYLPKSLPVGTWVSLSGKLKVVGKRRTLTAPQYEKISGSSFQLPGNKETIHTGRLVPIYPETSGLSSKWLRNRISYLLPEVDSQIKEYLPEKYLKKYFFINLPKAIKDIHFPDNQPDAAQARRRLAYDEFLKIQLNNLYRKESWKSRMVSHELSVDQEKVFAFIESLPFPLTSAQNRSIKEILEDLNKPQAMNRLLEGDVGSGKTVVAAVACLVAHSNGFQSAIMAPTQILATQHYKTLKTLLEPHGIGVTLVISDPTSLKLRRGKQATDNQKTDIYVGTQALLHRTEIFQELGLVVIDEQHRFGVKQRALLSSKPTTNYSPHILTMTATPIPRTVALTMYGDLDLSVLDVMPKGRLTIKTWVVPPQKRDGAYKWIRERVKNTDEQAFIVCPIIEESEKETMQSVKAATQEFEKLSKEVFPDLKLGLLHGKIKRKDKDIVMEKFKSGEIDILVATPVVEVGIDIPNATIMMIEASERFGLAQLHQLRGRVGRSDKQSYCLLMTESRNPKTLQRLNALERNLSGPQLAELDLELRGPGEVYGTAQSGFPELKVGSFADLDLIKAARETAQELITQPQIASKLIDKIQEVVPN